jgi:hypothetical protein
MHKRRGNLQNDTSIGVLIIFESDRGSTSGGISFDGSQAVEKNETTTLKYGHFIEDVTDPYIFVDLHF